MTTSGITNINAKLIHQHPDNPRKDLGDLSELSESIKKKGIMQNLTVIPGMEEGLTGAEVTCQPAVTDGHITTSRGLGTAIDFALALISELRDKESADTISKQVVYER